MKNALQMLPGKTMSSLEVAALTGKTPGNVNRDIRSMCELLGYSNLNSNNNQGVTVFLNEGGQTKEIILDHDHTMSLVSGYEVNLRMAIIRRWKELESIKIDPMQALNDPATMRSLLLGYSEKVLTLESSIKILEPKAVALDRLSSGEGSQCITDAAKALKVQPKSLFKTLQASHWIYKRAGGKNWLGYQDKIQQGLIEHKLTTVSRSDGSEKITEQALLTPKGMVRLSAMLGEALL